MIIWLLSNVTKHFLIWNFRVNKEDCHMIFILHGFIVPWKQATEMFSDSEDKYIFARFSPCKNSCESGQSRSPLSNHSFCPSCAPTYVFSAAVFVSVMMISQNPLSLSAVSWSAASWTCLAQVEVFWSGSHWGWHTLFLKYILLCCSICSVFFCANGSSDQTSTIQPPTQRSLFAS